ncbi:MAG TPA: hypothetical protein VFJ17_00080 [Mycobacteriales bacterium]|nr:hypothetical protein [Mycobacteriales bacterium]
MTTPKRTGSFDRIRPRTAAVETPAVRTRDAQGKRALFSATEGERDLPGVGSISVECQRCGERTVLSPMAAVRAAFPSLLLSVDVGHGDRESTVGLFRRRFGAYLRCPACKRPSWARLTVRV